MNSTYCIDCGRELKEYPSQTLHCCTLCETKKGIGTINFLYTTKNSSK